MKEKKNFLKRVFAYLLTMALVITSVNLSGWGMIEAKAVDGPFTWNAERDTKDYCYLNASGEVRVGSAWGTATADSAMKALLANNGLSYNNGKWVMNNFNMITDYGVLVFECGNTGCELEIIGNNSINVTSPYSSSFALRLNSVSGASEPKMIFSGSGKLTINVEGQALTASNIKKVDIGNCIIECNSNRSVGLFWGATTSPIFNFVGAGYIEATTVTHESNYISTAFNITPADCHVYDSEGNILSHSSNAYRNDSGVPKYIKIGKWHEHDFGYAAEENKITATCKTDASHTYTLTLSADNLDYSSIPVEPSITFGTSDEQIAWTGAGINLPGSTGTGAPEVTKIYYKADASGNKDGAALGTTPTAVGKYVVEVNVTYGEGTDKKVSVALLYDINKASQATPASDQFDVTSTADTVTVAPKSGDTTEYEYSIDSTNWVSSGAFTGLTDAKKYTVSVRVKETATHSASPTLTIDKYTIAKTPASASEGATVDNSTEKITIVDDYEVSTTDTFESTIANDATVNPNTTYYVRKQGKAEKFAPSASVSFTTPERAITPATPVLDVKSDVSIKVTPVTGVEYSINGTDWNTTGEFTELTADRTYTVKARVKATDTKFASLEASLEVKTKASGPAVPTADMFTVTSTENTITVTKKETTDANDYEFSIDNGTTWVSSGAFTALTDANKYDVLVRIKETDTTMASESLTLAKYTLAKTPASASEGATVDNSTEKITILDGYEVSTMDTFTSTIENDSVVTPNTTYYVRKQGVDGEFGPSASVSFTTPERAVKPDSPALNKKSDVSIKVDTIPGAEYSIDGGVTWNTTGEFTDLTPNTSYTVTTRIKSTNEKYASETVTTTITTKNAAPVAPADLTSTKPTTNGGKDGKITGVDSTMEYSTDGGNTWRPVTGTEITGLSSGDVKVRVKETSTTAAGIASTVTVESNNSPVGLTTTSESEQGAKDGKITGVTEAMEYSVDGGNTWVAVTGTEITGLSSGDVKVRLKATATTPAGDITVVDVTLHVHNFGSWVDDKNASTQANGTETRTCATCGKKEIREIPDSKIVVPVTSKDGESAKEGAGLIKTSVNVDKTVPVSQIDNLNVATAKTLLTAEEKEQVDAGATVSIFLDITNIDEKVTVQDKTKVEEAVQKFSGSSSIGMYLDLSLFKKVSTEEKATRITETGNNALKITVAVPEKLLEVPAGMERSYVIVRIHDGKADVLNTFFDKETGKLSFETDRFSTYAIIYSDIELPSGDDDDDDSNDGTPAGTSPATGDMTPITLYVVMLLGSIVALASVMFTGKKRRS